MTPSADPCGLSGLNYQERYGEVDLFLTLLGTGSTRTLHVLTARNATTRRGLFAMRVEAGLEHLIVRGRRAQREPDDELRETATSYARYLVDSGAYIHAPHFLLQIGAEAEILVPLSRAPTTVPRLGVRGRP
jgi:hypothetical protein